MFGYFGNLPMLNQRYISKKRRFSFRKDIAQYEISIYTCSLVDTFRQKKIVNTKNIKKSRFVHIVRISLYTRGPSVGDLVTEEIKY